MKLSQKLLQEALSWHAKTTLRYVEDAAGIGWYAGDFSSDAVRRLRDMGMREHWLNRELGSEHVQLELDGITVELS